MYEYDKEIEQFIPPFFDLNNYKNIKTYSIYDWICALSERDYCYLMSLSYQNFYDENITFTVQQELDAYQPIICRGSNYLDNPFVDEGIEENGCIEDLEDGYIVREDETGMLAFPRINLMVPDEFLIKKFREWVVFTKAQRGISHYEIHSQLEVSRWYRYKVLPYIDLKTWNDIKGQELTNQIAGQILFEGDSRNATDLIKKHTTKLYRKMITASFCNNLYCQV